MIDALDLPPDFVHRRIGGLETRRCWREFRYSVHRRIGGLEKPATYSPAPLKVHRRIGGLEKL